MLRARQDGESVNKRRSRHARHSTPIRGHAPSGRIRARLAPYRQLARYDKGISRPSGRWSDPRGHSQHAHRWSRRRVLASDRRQMYWRPSSHRPSRPIRRQSSIPATDLRVVVEAASDAKGFHTIHQVPTVNMPS